MIELIVCLSFVIIFLAIGEWFLDETETGRALQHRFRDSMRRNSKKPRQDKYNEDKEND